MLCVKLREWIWWASKARNVLENNIQNSIINNILVAKPNALYVNIHLNWVVFYIVGILAYFQTLNLIKF